MTMFQELYTLATTATLTMIVSADDKTGKLTISVLPKPKKDIGEAALTKDLTLTASPEEFDDGFVQALQGYRAIRASLTEQAEATKEVLEAAKLASTKKATEAIAKASKSATAAKPAASAKADALGEDHDDESGGDEGENENQSNPNPTEQATAPAAGETLSLFG
jgi:PRTRC genetic system protein E